MAEKLSLAIKETLHKYYIHRQRQARDTWNKEADLDMIFETAKREGWDVEAVAGHFWFSKKILLGTHVIEITEKTFPKGGYSNIKDDYEPYGMFSWIVNILQRKGNEPRSSHENTYKQNNSQTEVGNTEEGECI